MEGSRKATTEFELKRLLHMKSTHSKMSSLEYNKLELQEYLKLETCNAAQAKVMFKFRCRMANFSENFRGPQGPKPCILCGVHLDNQETSFECVKVNIREKSEM